MKPALIWKEIFEDDPGEHPQFDWAHFPVPRQSPKRASWHCKVWTPMWSTMRHLSFYRLLILQRKCKPQTHEGFRTHCELTRQKKAKIISKQNDFRDSTYVRLSRTYTEGGLDAEATIESSVISLPVSDLADSLTLWEKKRFVRGFVTAKDEVANKAEVIGKFSAF